MQCLLACKLFCTAVCLELRVIKILIGSPLLVTFASIVNTTSLGFNDHFLGKPELTGLLPIFIIHLLQKKTLGISITSFFTVFRLR